MPTETPVTSPDPETTVATAVLLLVQPTPPPVASLKADVEPTHRAVLPVIAAGNAFTVTILDAEHEPNV